MNQEIMIGLFDLSGGLGVGPRQPFDIVNEPENNEWFF